MMRSFGPLAINKTRVSHPLGIRTPTPGFRYRLTWTLLFAVGGWGFYLLTKSKVYLK